MYSSIKELEAKYSAEVEAFCLSMLTNESQALVLRIDLFYKLAGRISEFDCEEEVKTFLFTSARDSCKKFLKYLKIINQ